MDLVSALTTFMCLFLAGLFVLGMIVMIAKSFVFVCEPNEVLVFSGRERDLEDGTTVGYRVVYGGWSFRVPVLERVERMDLRTIPIDVQVHNAYSKGGIPLAVHAVANVKVSRDEQLIGNAIERFLGRDPAEIKRVAKETLEGHLRGVLATLTPEEVNEDRLKFAGALVEESGEDFHRLGLHLDTLKVQAVSDEVNYLDSIGRQRIALVLRDAEVAESTFRSEAERAEASSRRAGEVAMQQANANIVAAENEVRRARAELDANAQAEEETTAQAALQARAESEQELQEIRKKLEEMRLMSDRILPAQAQQQAQAFRARGEASSIEENGRAGAAVLMMMTDAWVKAGKDAKDIFLIQNLEQVLETVVKRVNGVAVEEVNLLDGGDGQALASYVASYPAMITSVLSELSDSTGVDVVGILRPQGIPVTTNTSEEG
ncbi:MAG: flotillin family protein [Alphaproteobacteria bacterium]|nr:flotillin family protein [Alphaproteobacteria bacterium]